MPMRPLHVVQIVVVSIATVAAAVLVVAPAVTRDAIVLPMADDSSINSSWKWNHKLVSGWAKI